MHCCDFLFKCIIFLLNLSKRLISRDPNTSGWIKTDEETEDGAMPEERRKKTVSGASLPHWEAFNPASRSYMKLGKYHSLITDYIKLWERMGVQRGL